MLCMRQKVTGYFIILLTIVICVGCSSKTKSQLQEIKIEDTEEQDTKKPNTKEQDTKYQEKNEENDSDHGADVCVYVCGAVNQPGVYTLSGSARIYEVIGLAGGVREDAAADYLNQAEHVTDGERIYVPTQAEASAGATEMMPGAAESEVNSEGSDSSGKINLNKATKEELMTLAGIGEAKAASIISYRENNGMFSNIEDIMQVEGIKEGVFRKIQEYITVS